MCRPAGARCSRTTFHTMPQHSGHDARQFGPVHLALNDSDVNTRYIEEDWRRCHGGGDCTQCIVLPYSQETRMIHRHIVTALTIVFLTGSFAAAQAPAGGGQRAGGAPPAPMKNL